MAKGRRLQPGMFGFRKRQRNDTGGQSGQSQPRPLPAKLADSLQQIRQEFHDASDLVVKQFCIGGTAARKAAVLYLEGMADGKAVKEAVIEPLMLWARPQLGGGALRGNLPEQIRQRLSPAQNMINLHSMQDVAEQLLEGNSVLLVDGFSVALGTENRGFPKRAVEAPETEVVVRGPREGFTEVVRDSVALVRRRLKTPGLVVEQMKVGRRSVTDVRLLYLAGVARPELVREVRQRVQAIDVDMAPESGIIEQLISDYPLWLFPLIQSTERPDTVAASLAEGRVALLVDHSPFALIMPNTLFQFFSTAEDYYQQYLVSLMLRLIRLGAFAISTFITAIYIASSSFHQELIPLPLLLNIAASEAGVPFPLPITAVAIELLLEVLREAGIRLPRQVGQAVSIVGAIVLGQAAVQAGFASAGLVIVAALGTIASFAIPNFEAAVAVRLLRFPFILLASVLGFYGLFLGAVILLFYLSSLQCFGVPFLSSGRALMLSSYDPWTRSPVRPYAPRERIRQAAPPRRRQGSDR